MVYITSCKILPLILMGTFFLQSFAQFKSKDKIPQLSLELLL